MTWSRPGPTPMSAIGTPTKSDDELQVVARGRRQVRLLAAVGEVLAPAGHLDVLAGGVVEHRLVVGEVVELRALGAAVPRAHAQPVEARQHVELGHRERGQRVDPRRVAQRDQVEPADAPRAPGRGAVFAAALADLVGDVAVELGRERPRAHARAVGLDHSPDLVDVLRPDAGADARRARHRVRRGDERIRAVVDVEQRALGALEHDRLAGVEPLVHEPHRVGDVVRSSRWP